MRRVFEKYGMYVARHPYPFFLIPLILSACFGYGLKFFTLENDTEYLVTPKNGIAKMERKVVQKYFHVDQAGGFLPDRSPVLDGFADLIVCTADGSNILTPNMMSSVLKLDNFVRNVTAYDAEDKAIKFDSLCATWGEGCIESPLLMLIQRNASLVPFVPLTYPIFNRIFLGHSLGNVTVNPETDMVESAGSMRMTFFVKYESIPEQDEANIWFTALINALHDYKDPNIIFYYSATNSLAQQFDEASNDIIPKFAAPFVLLITFSILSCMMSDWVRSKPWLALAGVTAAGLSLMSVFGLLSALGIRAVPQVGLVPFLTLGKFCFYL